VVVPDIEPDGGAGGEPGPDAHPAATSAAITIVIPRRHLRISTPIQKKNPA
jgi:hypothetical protein